MPVQVSQELIDDLVEIGTLQNDSPSSLGEGKHSDLGLHVEMRSQMGLTSLKAGGRFFSKVELWQERPGGNWHVKKYKADEWERLVKPTLEWARWIHRLIWEQETVSEKMAKLEDGSADVYDAWLWAAKNCVLLDYWASSKLAERSFKRTRILTLLSLENLEWINLVTDMGFDFSKIRNTLDDMASEMADIRGHKKEVGVPETKDILAKLESLDANLGILHEKLRTIEIPDTLPLKLNDFWSALLQVFLYASSKIRATQEFYKLLLETKGLIESQEELEHIKVKAKWLGTNLTEERRGKGGVESQKKLEFLTVMADWLGVHRAEEKAIQESLLALLSDS